MGRALTAGQRVGVNPLTGETVSQAFIGNFVPGTGNTAPGGVLSGDSSYPRGWINQPPISPRRALVLPGIRSATVKPLSGRAPRFFITCIGMIGAQQGRDLRLNTLRSLITGTWAHSCRPPERWPQAAQAASTQHENAGPVQPDVRDSAGHRRRDRAGHVVRSKPGSP